MVRVLPACPRRSLWSSFATMSYSMRVFPSQPKQIQDIKDFLVAARRKDAKCELAIGHVALNSSLHSYVGRCAVA